MEKWKRKIFYWYIDYQVLTVFDNFLRTHWFTMAILTFREFCVLPWNTHFLRIQWFPMKTLNFWEFCVLPWKHFLFCNSVFYHSQWERSMSIKFSKQCQKTWSHWLIVKNTGGQHPSSSLEAYLEPSQVSLMEHFCENI